MSLDSLVKKANFIDKMDAITGPTSALFYHSGSDILAGVGAIISTAELAVKIPFAVQYVSHTKDYKALAMWTAKELFSNFNPELGYVDIFPIYSMRVKYYLACK